MQILKTDRFFEEVEVIVDFIASDSLERALVFLDDLDKAIFSLSDFAYRCRKSTKSNDENIRDLVFKGYVIPYHINKSKNSIEILGIFSQNEWSL